MSYEDAVNNFERIYIQCYINHWDYWAAFEAWSSYIDGLYKDGQITLNQYETWQTPFPYGKKLKPNKRQLQIAADGCGMW